MNISDEYYHTPINSGNAIIDIDERGTLFGVEGGIGFQDRLVKKVDLFVNTSLTYNYLFVIDDKYYFNHHKQTIPFLAFKVSFLYKFNFRK
jgi:hypothetical protein